MIRITSINSSIGILTHQSHISTVCLTHWLTHWLTYITSRASCDFKNENKGYVTSHTISPFRDILIKKILMWWRRCSSCGKHGGRRAVARCPVLMIGKLTFCLDFPREFEITSDQQTNLATFPNKSFSCTQWCKMREVIFLLLCFSYFHTFWGCTEMCSFLKYWLNCSF